VTFRADLTMHRTVELDGRHKTILAAVKEAHRFLETRHYDTVDLTIRDRKTGKIVVEVTLTREEMEVFMGRNA